MTVDAVIHRRQLAMLEEILADWEMLTQDQRNDFLNVIESMTRMRFIERVLGSLSAENKSQANGVLPDLIAGAIEREADGVKGDWDAS